MANQTLQAIREERLKKVARLREMGINPYPPSYDRTHSCAQAVATPLGQEVSVAGRLISFRLHGAIAFADLKDESGNIQVFFKKDSLEENFKLLEFLDIGDIIGVKGEVVKTSTGQISICPKELIILSKSLRPLPSEWFGLKDTEERFRKRYLDTLLNPEVKARFDARTKIIRETRRYLDDLGFMEIETPILQPLYGGANAKPFTTHINALGQNMYLRIAFELYLKRMVVGGYEKVYEIGKDFRNEGMDLTHNPEFTMIEWYESFADYHRVMDVTEGLFKHLAQSVSGSTQLSIEDKTVDIGISWPRIKMVDAVKNHLNFDVTQESQENLIKICHQNNLELVGGETKGQLIFTIFDKLVARTLIKPTWIIDYPKEISPLSKDHRTDNGWVERFEGYIGGKEICDGWSELTDPLEQRARFEADVKAARKDKEEAQQIDENFLEAMEYGMPPLGGIGIGIDRLTMFFTNTWSIKEVILFPTMKPENQNE